MTIGNFKIEIFEQIRPEAAEQMGADFFRVYCLYHSLKQTGEFQKLIDEVLS